MATRRTTASTAKKPSAGKKSAGRPPGLKPEVQKRILDAIRAGAFMAEAAAAAGISRRTLHRWVKRGEGRDADPRFQKFADAVARARAEAHVGAIAVIRRAMLDDWKAAAFYLERSDPARWGRRTALEHSGPEGGPIEVGDALDLSRLTEAELAKLQALLERADGTA